MRGLSKTINILIDTETSFIPKAEYVFRTFCRILGLNARFYYGKTFEEIQIYYGNNSEKKYPLQIFHNPDAVLFFDNKKVYPSEKIIKYKFQKEMIPFLFSPNGDLFIPSENYLLIRKDIISSAFYFLSCWDEYGDEEKDNERFNIENSIQSKNDFLDIPVVDRYCSIFSRAINIILPGFYKGFIWEKDKKFAVSISHDIDYWEYWSDKFLQKTFEYNLKRLKKHPINALYKLIFHFVDKIIFKQNTRKRNKKLFRNEKKMSIRPTCFFLSKEDFEDERQNYFSQNIKKIKKMNTTVGLHASMEAAYNLDILKNEIEIFNKSGIKVKGVRFHYLGFNYQTTFRNLEYLGITFDSTLGFWENIGFRAGISFPFYPYNLQENRPFRVLEIPLIVMDMTMFSKKSMNLSPNTAKKKLRNLIDNTRKSNGHISILFHNTMFDPVDYPGWSNVFWDTLKYAKRKKGWLCSPNQLFNYWKRK